MMPDVLMPGSEPPPLVRFTLRMLDADTLEALAQSLVQDMVHAFGAHAARVSQGRRVLAQVAALSEPGEIWRFPLTSTQAAFPLALELSLGADQDLLLLRQQFVDLVAIARRTAQKLVALEAERRHAREDVLTGLANRRTVEIELAKELARSQQSKAVVSVMVVDLDHFKQINDTLGHAVGDEVLRAAGESFVSQLRLGDLAGRWGGDEFVVVLPGTAAAAAVGVGERLRVAFAQDLRSRGATMSIGVADSTFMIGESVSEDAANYLLEAADRSLYASKKAGRNRVTSWTAA